LLGLAPWWLFCKLILKLDLSALKYRNITLAVFVLLCIAITIGDGTREKRGMAPEKIEKGGKPTLIIALVQFVILIVLSMLIVIE